MSLRYVKTERWDDPWFRYLSGEAKLLFIFLVDKCDWAGFFERDDRWLAGLLKFEEEKIQKAYQELENKITIKDRWIFVNNFILHQGNKHLNPENNAHKKIITSLVKHANLFGDIYKEILGITVKELMRRAKIVEKDYVERKLKKDRRGHEAGHKQTDQVCDNTAGMNRRQWDSIHKQYPDVGGKEDD